MRSTAVRRALWVLVAALVSGVSQATPRLPFRNFGTDQGLPQSQVLALHQDHRGELWVGTWNGAACFDGADFRYLSLRAGLPNPAVFDIEEDAEGDLYLAAGTAIARLGSDRTRIAEVYTADFSDLEGNWLRDLYVDRRGVLWAAAQHGGVAFVHEGRLVTLDAPDLAVDALQVFAETRTGELLLGTSEGVFVVEDGRCRRWSDAPGPWNRPVTMLYVGKDGLFLLANPDGVWRIGAREPDDGPSATELSAGRDSIPQARSALVDRFGQLWIATETGVYRDLDDRIVRLGKRQGLPGEGRFYSLLEDREGYLWIGSDDGLSLHPGDLFRIYQPLDGQNPEAVWSLATESRGRLVVGTRSAGAFFFDGERFTPLPSPTPLPGKRIRAIVEDDEGRLWFGTHNDGLFRWDGEDWQRFSPPEISSLRIYSALRDRNGTLWFATRHGVTSYRDGRFRIWRSAQGLPSDLVSMVLEDPEGRIVASTAGGLARLDGETFSVPPDLEALSGIPVRSLLFRRDGTLWAGTEGLGLYARIGGEWVVYRADGPGPNEETASDRTAPEVRGGPADDFAWGLVEDEGGRLWLATNHGLDLYDGTGWTHFSQRDGLLRHELASNAALATPDGAAWFGFPGGGGLVRFPPELPRPRNSAPIVRITAVETARGKLLAEPPRVEVPWEERDMTFSYIAVSFRDASRIAYRTRLEPYDSGYSLRMDRSVRYTNLGPGSYRFFVEAVATDGTWTSEAASVAIEILPPFYRTWWFYLLSAALILGLIVSFHGLRLRTVATEKRILEAKIKERTRELLAEKSKLETALDQVRTLSGLLPICSSCNKIRDEGGDWKQLEHYIERHSEASFSHSICPSCARDLYPDLYPEKK